MNFSARRSEATWFNNKNWKVLHTIRPERGYPTIHIIQGSVLDFHAPTAGAIVNAANEGCIGGGGVDGAISRAGGPNLAEDRWALPVLDNNEEDLEMQDDDDSDSSSSMSRSLIRCRTGSAVLTGPGEYGALQVPYVIHAVGPNLHLYDSAEEVEYGLQLLQSAYTTTLDIAAADTNAISEVAFSLLSAGIFRGTLKLSKVLLYGLTGIKNWVPPTTEGGNSTNPLTALYICGFNDKECSMLVKVAQHLWRDERKKTCRDRPSTMSPSITSAKSDPAATRSRESSDHRENPNDT